MKTSLSILLLAIPLSVQAADIYRWVDEQGRTHIADTVPEKYRKSAKRIDSSQYEVNEADRKAALERARQIATHPVSKSVPQEDAQAKQTTALDAPPPPVKKKIDPNDCNALRAQYAESQACFAPYRNANGSLKEEAFAKCQDVPDPSFKCGASSHY